MTYKPGHVNELEWSNGHDSVDLLFFLLSNFDPYKFLN